MTWGYVCRTLGWFEQFEADELSNTGAYCDLMCFDPQKYAFKMVKDHGFEDNLSKRKENSGLVQRCHRAKDEYFTGFTGFYSVFHHHVGMKLTVVQNLTKHNSGHSVVDFYGLTRWVLKVLNYAKLMPSSRKLGCGFWYQLCCSFCSRIRTRLLKHVLPFKYHPRRMTRYLYINRIVV